MSECHKNETYRLTSHIRFTPGKFIIASGMHQTSGSNREPHGLKVSDILQTLWPGHGVMFGVDKSLLNEQNLKRKTTF